MSHYKELLKAMTTAELVAEKKGIGAQIADIFREYFGSVRNAPSWEIDELDLLYAKRDAIVHEAKLRIAEGRI